MRRQNFIKEKLAAGKSVIGTWAMIPSPETADILASSGLDFIIIDAEHGPISFETAQRMVMACESKGCSPIMRVGGILEADILKALDIGVHGIQIPNVNSADDVKKIIHFSKYPPSGNRGFSPFTRAGNYSIHSSKDQTIIANDNTLIAINIEGKEAIESIDEILAIKELDILFIGLFDLSKALGIPGQIDHPMLTDYLITLVYKINKAGKVAGTITTSDKNISKFLGMGMRYIVHLVDCEMLRNSYTEMVNHFNSSNTEKTGLFNAAE
ncbi:MAG: hypothetical protein LCH54_07510 [Bacteroidetes bacterium]|nr:hypothetical protein [Bacteroidota bacterium]